MNIKQEKLPRLRRQKIKPQQLGYQMIEKNVPMLSVGMKFRFFLIISQVKLSEKKRQVAERKRL